MNIWRKHSKQKPRCPSFQQEVDLLLTKTVSRVPKCWQLHHGSQQQLPLVALSLERALCWHPNIQAVKISRPKISCWNNLQQRYSERKIRQYTLLLLGCYLFVTLTPMKKPMRGRSVRDRKMFERSVGGLFSGCRKMWAISGLGPIRAVISSGALDGRGLPSGPAGKSKSKLAKVHTKEFSCWNTSSVSIPHSAWWPLPSTLRSLNFACYSSFRKTAEWPRFG